MATHPIKLILSVYDELLKAGSMTAFDAHEVTGKPVKECERYMNAIVSYGYAETDEGEDGEKIYCSLRRISR